MKLSLNQTKSLVELVLSTDLELARTALDEALPSGYTEASFATSLIGYANQIHLNDEQWFGLLSRFPFRVLRDDLRIMSKLSENQKAKLPPVLFEKT